MIYKQIESVLSECSFPVYICQFFFISTISIFFSFLGVGGGVGSGGLGVGF